MWQSLHKFNRATNGRTDRHRQNTASEIVQDSNNLHRDGASGHRSSRPSFIFVACIPDSRTSPSPSPRHISIIPEMSLILVASRKRKDLPDAVRTAGEEGCRRLKFPRGKKGGIVNRGRRPKCVFPRRAACLVLDTHLHIAPRRSTTLPLRTLHVFFGEPEAVSAPRGKEDIVETIKVEFFGERNGSSHRQFHRFIRGPVFFPSRTRVSRVARNDEGLDGTTSQFGPIRTFIFMLRVECV